ncbi:MAG TPA: hypothetical protein VF581_12745 [Flavobacterium sp.]|jgi:hypothetical protein
MFKVKITNLPAGKNVKITQISPVERDIPYDRNGNLLGPEGTEYVLDFPGKGIAHLKDVGNAFKGPKGEWGVQINKNPVFNYSNEGVLTIDMLDYKYPSAKFSLDTFSIVSILAKTDGTTVSNLENQRYGYDFVLATTQESMLANAKKYLDKPTFTVVKRYYTYGSSGKPVEWDEATFMRMSENTDPFAVNAWNGQGAVSAGLQRLINIRFAFAFEAAAGLPKRSLEIFKMNPDRTFTYKMGFAKFNIAELARDASKYVRLSQNNSSPWIFDTVVNLQQSDPSYVPTNVRNAYNSLIQTHGEFSFVIKQIAMNFDAAVLKAMPAIPISQTDALPELTKIYKELFVKSTKDSSVATLNYSILNNPARQIKANNLQLTEVQHGVSPYKPAFRSAAAADSRLDTQNYYYATENKRIPALVPFEWNWVEPDEVAEFNGVISVSRGNFMNYLNRVLSEQLPTLDIVPNVWMSYDRDLVVKWTHEMGHKSGQAFKILARGTTTSDNKPAAMFYKLENRSFNSTYWDAGISNAEGHYNYFADIEVTVKDRIITVTTHCRARMEYKKWAWETGTAVGNVADITSVFDYEMSVNNVGKLQVTRRQVSVTNRSEDLSLNNLSKTQIEHVVEPMRKIKADVTTAVENAMSNFTSSLEEGINNMQNWAFPGGEAFTFKDVTFSRYEDLIVHINYVTAKTMMQYGPQVAETETEEENNLTA